MTIPWINSGCQVTDSDQPSTEPTDEQSVYSPYGVVLNSNFESDRTESQYNDETSLRSDDISDCFYKLKTVIFLRVLSSTAQIHNKFSTSEAIKRSNILQIKRSRKRKINTFWKLIYTAYSLLISSEFKQKVKFCDKSLLGKNYLKNKSFHFFNGSKVRWISVSNFSESASQDCIARRRKRLPVQILKLLNEKPISTSELFKQLTSFVITCTN